MKKFIVLVIFLLAACRTDNPNIVQDFPKDQYLERKQNAGNMFGNKEGIIIFEDKSKIEENYNMSLWKKVVDVISSIAPISIADEKTGLIVTDWNNINSISGNDELYKINIIVTGKEIKKENLKISAFKKINGGKSVNDANVENKIIDIILVNKNRN